MWLLFIPIVVLLAFMLVSAVAGVVWVVGGMWPWLLIAIGAWLFWHQDGHPRRARPGSWWAGQARVVASESRPRPVAATQPRGAEKKVQLQIQDTELPIDVQVKVEQIRRKVDVLLGYADRFPPFSRDLYLVRQTAADYLPRTISTFLGLPKDAVDSPHVAGRTAREELRFGTRDPGPLEAAKPEVA
jgi:hypothetical protein